jgi:UDP-N-acetylglucosamine acyltransferase
MSKIHSTAIIDPGAEVGEEVEIGPYCVIGPHVKLGVGTRLMPHVVIDGWTVIGAHCTIFPFASIGQQTQDLKFKGGNSRVEIGDQTTIREYVTVNAATNDGDVTTVGSGCHIMAYAHIAHDCHIGNGVIMGNCATLAGHITIEDEAGISGLCGVHQFVRIGRLSYLGGCSKLTQDLPPFMMADGNPLEVPAINSVGLKRRGISEAVESLIKKAHRILYREGFSTRQALEKIEMEIELVPEIQHLINFIKSSERGIVK